MKTLTITLIFLLCALTFSDFTSGPPGDFTNPYPYDPNTGAAGGSDSGAPSCANAISNANRAFTQLVSDLKTQAYQWSINSDFDAVDEVSYFLKSKCKTQYLDLINSGKTGVNATEDQACEDLMMLLVPLLEQKKAASFRGSFEGSIALVGKGRKIAKKLGDECKPLLVAREADEVSEGGETLLFDEEEAAGKDNSVTTNLRIITSEYDQDTSFEIVVDVEEEEYF